jgi:hypothetical protein
VTRAFIAGVLWLAGARLGAADAAWFLAGKTVFNEFLEIREEQGVLTYFAQLRLGGPVTPFAASKVSDTEVVFSNPQHDYPTRIIYRKQPDGGLFARVEGERNGKLAGEEFRYRRVKCD